MSKLKSGFNCVRPFFSDHSFVTEPGYRFVTEPGQLTALI